MQARTTKKVTFIVFHNESEEDESTSEEDDDDYEEDESDKDEISDSLVAKKKVRILFSVDLFGHGKIIIIISPVEQLFLKLWTKRHSLSAGEVIRCI